MKCSKCGKEYTYWEDPLLVIPIHGAVLDRFGEVGGGVNFAEFPNLAHTHLRVGEDFRPRNLSRCRARAASKRVLIDADRSASARTIEKSGLKSLHPDWSADAINLSLWNRTTFSF